MKSETELDKLLDHIAFYYPGVPLDGAERELFALRAREQALVVALKQIVEEDHCDNDGRGCYNEHIARAALAAGSDLKKLLSSVCGT